MKGIVNLDEQISQARFAEIVKLSEARVSQLIAERTLVRGDTASEWLDAYHERLRDQAAGRAGDTANGLDLVQERAALAREQRLGIEIKNAVARGEYAPVSLLAEVLAIASQSVSERFEQLPGKLRKACPEMLDAARDQVMTTIADARNEWVRATAKLVVQRLDTDSDDFDAVIDA